MNRYFHMNSDLFDKWTDMLLDHAYDWKYIDISDEYCNKLSEPIAGLRLINWPDRSFQLINEEKYTIFLLRYQ